MKYQRTPRLKRALTVAGIAVGLVLGGAIAASAVDGQTGKEVAAEPAAQVEQQSREGGKPHDDSLSPLPCSMTKGAKPCVDDKKKGSEGKGDGKRDECNKHKPKCEPAKQGCEGKKPKCESTSTSTTTTTTKPVPTTVPVKCDKHKSCGGHKPKCEKKCEETTTTSTSTTTSTTKAPTTTTTTKPVPTTVPVKCDKHKSCGGHKPKCEKKCEETTTTSTSTTTSTTKAPTTTTTTKPAVAPVVTTPKALDNVAAVAVASASAIANVDQPQVVAQSDPGQSSYYYATPRTASSTGWRLANTGFNVVTAVLIAFALLMAGGILLALSRARRGERMMEAMDKSS